MLTTLQRLAPLLLAAASLLAVWQKFSAAGQTAPEWVSSKQQHAGDPAPLATATPAASEPAELSWTEFFSQSPHLFLWSLWSGSIIFRALFAVVLFSNARKLYDATKLPQGPSLVHWAGAVLAHRGYRSEAQQTGKLAVRGTTPARSRSNSSAIGQIFSLSRAASRFSSRRGSRADLGAPTPPAHSRCASRDEPLTNPLVAAASLSLVEKTVGGTPRDADGLLMFPRRRSLSGTAPFTVPAAAATSATPAPSPPVAASPALPPRHASPPVNASPNATLAPTALDVNNYNIPENSMLAYIYAHENGVHGVEVDICLTRDGHILVMHDNTVDRTMDATGEVPLLTLEQIREFRYRKVTHQEYTIKDPRNKNIDIIRAPTLEQVILFCRERNLKLMIESKEYTNPALLREKINALYEKYDMYSWSFFASFNPLHIYHVRREFPRIPTCLLYCRTCTEWYHQDASKEMLLPSWLNFEVSRQIVDWTLWYFSPTWIASWLGVSMVGPHNILISPALITSLTNRGIVCDVWTVNSPLEKQWLQSLGCIVTSDRLFSHEDVSPFAPVEPIVVPPMLARVPTPEGISAEQLAQPMMRRPSINDALQLVSNSYYIHTAPTIVSPLSPEEGASDGSVGQTPVAPLSPTAEESAAAAAAAALASSAADGPLVGLGSVSVAHLRSGSDAVAPTPTMSPHSLVHAEDRLPTMASLDEGDSGVSQMDAAGDPAHDDSSEAAIKQRRTHEAQTE